MAAALVVAAAVALPWLVDADRYGPVIVDRARITGGRIRIYDDAVLPGRRQELAVAPIDATIRGWGGDEPSDLDMSVGLGRSALGVRARLHAGGDRPLLTMQARGKAVRV